MAPTLRSRQASETVDNQAEAGPSTSRSTLPVANTPTSGIVDDDDEHIAAGNPDDTIEDLEAVTAHNQEVIERQRLQLRRVRQEIEFEDNKRELQELNQRLQEGPPTTTSSGNDAGSSHGLRRRATTDIAPPPFRRLVKPREPRLYAGGVKSTRWRLQEYLDEINQNRELMPEQFPTEWDFIVWAGTYLEKTAMSDWRKQKEQHDHTWVTYNNYLKVLEKNLSPGEDTDERNIIAFNAAEPRSHDTITSWYDRLSELYRFLPASHKEIGETLIRDRWRSRLPHHVLTELRRWDPMQVARQSVQEISAHLDAIIDHEPFRSRSDTKKDRQNKVDDIDKSTTRMSYHDRKESPTEQQTTRTQSTQNSRRRGNNSRGSYRGSNRNQGQNPNHLPVAERTTTTTTQTSAASSRRQGDFVPRNEVDARKAAGLCIKCGVAGHWTNECTTGWSTAVTTAVDANK